MKRFILYPLTLGLVLALGLVPCRATENSTNPEPEDPSGNAGTVKSTVETGGGYNAYNGNASRSITDLQVPGAPGVYGLDFTRHWNSTDPMYSPFGQFGPRPFGNGGWSHSWNWSASVDVKAITCDGESNPCEGGNYGSYVHSINVEYPDGRTAKFSFAHTIPDAGDPDPFSPEPYPPVLKGTLGTDDHLGGIDPDGNFFWLYRADGGSVYFQLFGSGYLATKVVDPHGLATELFYQHDDWGDRLWRVAGPDGRSIFLEYRSLEAHPAAVIGKVGWGVSSGSYYQTVEYDYSHYSMADPATAGAFFNWYALTGVRYMDDINAGQLVQATYTYTPVATHDTTPLTPSPQGRGPLLTTADDPRLEGPMSRIRYVFRGAPETGGQPFCQSVNPQPHPLGGPSMMYAPFPIEKEISLVTGEVVSQLWIPCNGMPETGMRTEYRGAGGARIFQFGKKGGLEPGAWMEEIPNGPDEWHPPEADPGPWPYAPGYNAGFEITRLTDFADNPNPATMPTDFHHNFRVKPWRSFDARGILTQYKYQTGEGFTGPAGNGRVKEVWHRGSDQTKRTYNWDNPTPGSEARDPIHIPNTYNHWLFSQTDERGNTTTYKRDRLMRVTEISYYDAWGTHVASESFTYNHFNQVTIHTLPSGAKKHYDYNGSFLWREWNTVDTIDEATIYTPDGFGRVATAQNARARAAGSYSAVMEYNSRHQVTKVHYPSTGWSSDPTVIYEYDKYGNCTAITNERGYRSTYAYDPYGRCVSYTEPVNAPACGGSSVGSRTWEWVYDRIATDGPKDASSHTSNKWRLQIEPAYNAAGDRRATARHYDYNDRLVFEFIGAIVSAGGSWNFDHGAFHQYEYDANGNKTKYTDPRGRVTTYGYDHRNRLTTTTETKRADQPANPVTVTEYDATGNKTKVTYPDQRFQEWRFHDPFGQPAQFFDERQNMTSLYYRWGPMKLTASVVTRRERDGGGTEEEQLTAFWHDDLGRLTTTVFPDESYEQSSYDLGQLKTWRTRKGALKTITGYDARGRETAHTWSDSTPGVTRLWDDANRLVNLANSVSSIDYSYDQAGQVREEGTAIMGAVGQSQSGRKEVSYCRYPNGEVSRITYPNGLSVQRTYTPRGQLESVNWSGGSVGYDYFPDGKVSELQYGNGVHTGFDYDARGFTRVVHHQAPQGNISHRTYWRDNRDRIIGWGKSGGPGQPNPKENGRGDRYDYDEEGQLRLASYEVANPQGGGTDPMRTDIFTYDKMGNRMGAQNHVASRGWTEFKRRNNGLNQYGEWYSIIHHDDHFAEDPEKANGVLMMEGWIGASFNALNQPIAMYSGSTLPRFVWFGYDPLGRCVKRWLGDDQGNAPEHEGGYAPGNPNPVVTYLYYDGWNLVQEGTAPDSPTLLYVHGGRVDEVVAQIKPQSNTLRYLQYDARGHCVFQTGTSGQIEEQYEYDAFGLPYFFDRWGNPATTANGQPGSPWGNRILFTGREWLSDMRIYDFRHRVYHPELGRFLQPDPKHFAAGDYNLYRYCHNDPINHRDPSGMYIESAWDILNIGMGIASFASNASAGNWGAAAVDGVGIILDTAATAIPIVPGGAGTAIKALRAVDRAYDVAERAAPNPGGRHGSQPHRDRVSDRAGELEAEGQTITAGGGRLPERSVITPEGNRRFPDISTVDSKGRTYHENVGKTTKAGEPVARERRALDDIHRATGRRPGFSRY